MKDKIIKLHFIINTYLDTYIKIYHLISSSYYFLIHLSLLSFFGGAVKLGKYKVVHSHVLFHFIDEINILIINLVINLFFERVRTSSSGQRV